MENVPRTTMCLVVHNRFFIDADVNFPYSASNLCLECTVLRDVARVDEMYCNALFKANEVAIWATSAQNKRLISQLQLADGDSKQY